MYKIDINCDLGESFGTYRLGETEEILKYVTSVNIACGFHAGDPTVMRETVALALRYGVKMGAHPGLPDLVGFGRREMAITAQEAYDMVVYQIGALQAFLTTMNGQMQHVKPHGALYNMAAKDDSLAAAIAQAVYDVSPSLILFGLASSALTRAGEKRGLQTAHEVFADRTYQADGSLTSRGRPNAMITNSEKAIQQMIQLVKDGKIITEQGSELALQADTICIHGDGAHAVTFARLAQEQFKAESIKVESFEGR